MHKLLQNHRAEHALITEKNTYSAAELQQLISHRRDILTALGIQRLGIHLDNGMEWIAFDLAAQEANITCIPLAKFFSTEQLQHCCSLAGIDAIVTDEHLLLKKQLPDFYASPASLDEVSLLLNKKIFSGKKNLITPLLTHAGDLVAKITFTSGSTGNPKGVLLTQQSINNVVQSLALRLQSTEMKRHLCLAPLPILLENIAGVYLHLQLGQTVMAPATKTLGVFGSSGLNPEMLADAIHTYQPDSLILFPQLLLALTLLAEQQKISCASFRFLAVGGAAVSPELIKRARRAGLPVYEGYGLSECASVVSLNVPGNDRIGSVGRVLPHQRVQIENGEIVVKGSGFSGYLHASHPESLKTPEQTDTGDEGYLDEDGFLHISGRKKNVIVNSFGRNINPEWPESRLLESEHVHHAVVIGEAKPFLSAILVSNEENSDPLQTHINQVNDSLPDYARIERWIRVKPAVFYSKKIMTANGRIKRDAVESAFATELKALEVSP